MKRIERTGWTYKEDDPRIEVNNLDGWYELELIGVYSKKGRKIDWVDWPPRKVKVILEIEE